ncbi:hypothetical protein GGH13_004204 [Coemansia sp. S155-1]|nr:hypothetical protein GGH13_004204 [Coemansia sp. S155-1]
MPDPTLRRCSYIPKRHQNVYAARLHDDLAYFRSLFKMGGHHDTLLKDPAIEEWIWMRQNTHRYFKINRRTAPALIGMGLIIPVATIYLAIASQDKISVGPRVKKSWAEAYASKN